jgi:CheY-like chemotaxis protein
MNEHSDNNTDNKTEDELSGSLPSDQEMGDHVIMETNENDNAVLEDSSEKVPVKNILFVDDEEPVRNLFKEALEKFGYTVRVASNGNEGLTLFRENPADLIITDIFMPEKDGHAFILEVMQDFPEAKIFAITGKKSFDPQMELDIAETIGAKRVFAKPCKLSVLLSAIKEL